MYTQSNKINTIPSQHTASYSKEFYRLSLSGNLSEEFTHGCLHRHKFTVEDMYYITEGIKNQVLLGYDDFFLVMHLFFLNNDSLDCLPVQNLLLFILKREDYKTREFIVMNGARLLQKYRGMFTLKVIKRFLEIEHEIIREFLEKEKLEVFVPGLRGCERFFEGWYNSLERKPIRVRFACDKNVAAS